MGFFDKLGETKVGKAFRKGRDKVRKEALSTGISVIKRTTGLFGGGKSKTKAKAEEGLKKAEDRIEEVKEVDRAVEVQEDLLDLAKQQFQQGNDQLEENASAASRDIQRRRKRALSAGGKGRRSTILTQLSDEQEQQLGNSSFRGKSILGR